MPYKVKVEEVKEPKEGERYSETRTIYEQVVVGLNIPYLVAVVNGQPYYQQPTLPVCGEPVRDTKEVNKP